MEILKLSRELASEASHVYALSWKTAYKNIVPQMYLDDLSLERWTPLLQDSPYLGYVLKDHNEIVATSSISSARDEKMKDWGEIVSIYVLPNHFHKGYGKKLFSFVVSELNKQGFRNIYLWVLKENHQARNFYEQNGFFPNGDQEIISVGGKDLLEIRYVYTIK